MLTKPVLGAKPLRLVLWLGLAAVAASAGCVPDAPPAIRLHPTTVVPEKCALVFWVDGMDREVFERLRRAGKLPNITRYFVRGGVTVRGPVTSIPSITYACNVAYHTGLLPGHHGITGDKWFDRYQLIFQDYTFIKTYQQVDGDIRARTIYELLADENTATILTPVRRGAARNIDNWASAGVAWFFGFQETVNHLTTLRFELIADVANRVGRWPRFILAYFAAPDTIAHAYGRDSSRYADILIDADRQIGHICQALEAAGILRRTYLTLVTDHGFVNSPKVFDVAEYLRRELKVPTIDRMFGHDVPLERRAEHFAKARAVVVAGGNRRCNIHLRTGPHWWRRPTEEEIDQFARPAKTDAAQRPWPGLPALLARHEAVELVMVNLGRGRIRVQNRRGIGIIDRLVRGGRKLYRYRVVSGADPLGYASVPQAAALMDGKYHDGDAWLAATLDTPKPDCVVQLVELNDSPRNGDIALFAARGWSFVGGDKSSHGGLHRRELLVPWFWAGPDLPAGGAVTGARTVDLMPTVLHLIGRGDAVPPGLDGRSIAGRLRAAKAAAAGH